MYRPCFAYAVRHVWASIFSMSLALVAIPALGTVGSEPVGQAPDATGSPSPVARSQAASDAAPVPKAGPAAEILLFTVPDYPAASKARNEGGVVDVVAHVDMDGVIIRYVIESPPSNFDDAVRQVLGKWIVVPPTCSERWVDKYELRFTIVFSAEDGHFYVSVKGLRFIDTVPPPAAGRPQFAAALDRHVMPEYPREAYRARVDRGLAQAQLHIDKDGKVTDVTVPFTYPREYFVRTTSDALAQWIFPPATNGTAGYVCVQVRFIVP